MSHGVLKNREPIGRTRSLAARPLRMLHVIEVSIGMRHEAEHPTGWIAQSGDATGAAIWVFRIAVRTAIRIDVADRDVTTLKQLVCEGFAFGDDATLGVLDGHLQKTARCVAG